MQHYRFRTPQVYAPQVRAFRSGQALSNRGGGGIIPILKIISFFLFLILNLGQFMLKKTLPLPLISIFSKNEMVAKQNTGKHQLMLLQITLQIFNRKKYQENIICLIRKLNKQNKKSTKLEMYKVPKGKLFYKYTILYIQVCIFLTNKEK